MRMNGELENKPSNFCKQTVKATQAYSKTECFSKIWHSQCMELNYLLKLSKAIKNNNYDI